MFTRVLAVITLMAAFSASATAQQWSAEQQEVWNFTNNCWDTWHAEEVETYLTECWSDDISYWYSDLALPHGKHWVAQADEWFKRNDNVVFSAQPHTINVDGEVAVIHYQLMGAFDSGEGDLNYWAASRTDVLKKRGGKWLVIAVHEHKQPFGS